MNSQILKMEDNPKLVKGGVYEDYRGRIDFVNDFNFDRIKRFYFISNKSIDFFRAWQGHKIEKRWFYCVQGKFEIRLIKIDNWDNPSLNLRINTYILNSNQPQILYIPSGYVNGFKSFCENSKLMVFSDYEFGANNLDEIRFPNTFWT